MENNNTNFSESKSIEITQAEKEMLYPKKKKINKKVLAVAIIFIVYTVLVGFIGAQIERKIIMNKIQSSYEDAFGNEDSDADKIYDDTNETDETTTEPEKQPVSIKLGQKIVMDDIAEFTLEKSTWSDEIKPSDTNRAYSYKSDVDSEKYFVLKGTVKSIASDSFGFDDISDIEVLINGKYKFDGYIQIEESDRNGFTSSVKPLQESVILIYASVSDEAYRICENVKVDIKIQSDLENADWRFDEEKPYEYYTVLLNNK